MSRLDRPQLICLTALLGYTHAALALPASTTNNNVTSFTNDNVTSSTFQTSLGVFRFQAEPPGRGTVGILISCTATYIFCVWTAVHPDINPRSTWGCRLWYKFVLMVLAVLVPEGLLVCAFGQWREAKKLEQAWRQNAPPGLEDELGMDGAFFVVMGGFLVQTFEKPEGRPKRDLHTAILTPTGFLYYLKKGNIVPASFDKSAITDKGKASNIAKLLACTQALWLIVQSTARFISKMPITLLEIHVLIQVVCTSFIYWWWWYKPLDIEEPVEITLVPVEGVDPSPNLQREDDFQVAMAESLTYRTDAIFVTKKPASDSIAIKSKAFFDLISYIYSEPAELNSNRQSQPSAHGALGMIVEGGLVIVVGGLHLVALKVHFPTTLESYIWIGSSIGMIFFPFVIVAIATFTRYERDLSKILWDVHFGRLRHRDLVPVVLKRIHNICANHAEQNVNNVKIQKRLQEISQVYYFLFLIGHYILIYTCLLSLLLYALSTLYVVVESYISLRDPPAGTFRTPRWGDYWPHL